MLGAKLISPFGLVGRLTTRGFQQRLRDYYYPSTTQSEADVHGDTQKQEEINITRFLLDYVLDLGPASLPKPKREVQDAEVPSSDVEMNRVSQDSDLRHRRLGSATL